MATNKATKTGTFIDELEESVEELSDWAVDYIEDILQVLAPDGRAFGMERLSKKEELKLYVEQLRGNETAWNEWIRLRVEKIQEILAKSGLDENAILSVHPYDIVQRAAIIFSDEKERELKEIQQQQAIEDEGREFEYRTLPPEEELSGGRER